jgi:hypothetical protein
MKLIKFFKSSGAYFTPQKRIRNTKMTFPRCLYGICSVVQSIVSPRETLLQNLIKKYVTHMPWNQTKSTMSYFFRNGLIIEINMLEKLKKLEQIYPSYFFFLQEYSLNYSFASRAIFSVCQFWHSCQWLTLSDRGWRTSVSAQRSFYLCKHICILHYKN